MRDEEEFRDFALAHTQSLYQAARLMCGDAHLAEDLVQETLVKVYVSWGKRSIDSPMAYAQTTLMRTFISSRRKRMSTEWPIPDMPETASPAGDDSSIERLDLIAALSTLPPADRAVLVARYFEDLSIETIAEAMRKSPAAVRRQASRALDKLRAVLAQHQPMDRGARC